jgi:DNA-directed RNA polymerase subunit RPC12/RpoP
VINDPPTPWNDAVVCGSCDRRFLPPIYASPPHDDPVDSDGGYLRCPECGQRYVWKGSAGWGPLDGS